MRPYNVPPPALNGGLYTGEPFKGPWANVPVTPDVDYLTHVNLKSAHPPSEALKHYPGGPRPGNNVQNMPGVDLDNNKMSYLDSSCSTLAPPHMHLPQPNTPIDKYGAFATW